MTQRFGKTKQNFIDSPYSINPKTEKNLSFKPAPPDFRDLVSTDIRSVASLEKDDGSSLFSFLPVWLRRF